MAEKSSHVRVAPLWAALVTCMQRFRERGDGRTPAPVVGDSVHGALSRPRARFVAKGQVAVQWTADRCGHRTDWHPPRIHAGSLETSNKLFVLLNLEWQGPRYFRINLLQGTHAGCTHLTCRTLCLARDGRASRGRSCESRLEQVLDYYTYYTVSK